MALEIQALTRVFVYSGVRLPDPGESMPLAAVKDLYSATYPELLSSAIDGPKREGDTLVYSFVRAVHDKG